jgi:uncharacterized protein with WD repeat
MEPKQIPRSEDFVKKRKLMVLVISIAIVITTATYVASQSYSSKTVNVIEIYLNILEKTNGSTQVTNLGNQTYYENDLTLYGGTTGYFRVSFYNNLNRTLVITAFEATSGGFSLISVNPHLPTPISQGHVQVIILGIRVPDQTFAGSLDVAMVVS